MNVLVMIVVDLGIIISVYILKNEKNFNS